MRSLKIYAFELALFVAVWTAAWFLFIRPFLARYRVTSGLLARLDAAEGNRWKRIELWLEAKKTLALMFLTSLFAAGKGAATVAIATTKGVVITGVSTLSTLQPTDLAPLQDKTIWSAFFGDMVSFHIIAALALLGAFLTLKGKVTAAAIVPAPGTAATGS